MTLNRYDESVAWLYQYCVTEVLGPGEEKEALATCHAYFAGFRQKYWEGRNIRPVMAAKHEELRARLAGKPVPGMAGFVLAKGTAPAKLCWLRLAATDRSLWLISNAWGHIGAASATGATLTRRAI